MHYKKMQKQFLDRPLGGKNPLQVDLMPQGKKDFA
jgi:hypothetical protein